MLNCSLRNNNRLYVVIQMYQYIFTKTLYMYIITGIPPWSKTLFDCTCQQSISKWWRNWWWGNKSGKLKVRQRSKLRPFWSPWQVKKILAKVANWREDLFETYLKNINNRTNLMNSTSGSITFLSLFPSRRSETRHECVNLLQ